MNLTLWREGVRERVDIYRKGYVFMLGQRNKLVAVVDAIAMFII